MTAAAVVSDREVRDRLLRDLDTTFFVEAGAGTGKTTALVSRVVELVARRGLRMERLVAITFTEAAAAELRDRIRQQLEQAALLGDDAEARARCAIAAREVDLASIQTIHAFAGALLRTYPLEAQLPPDFATLDEIQQERSFDDRFRAWLYDEVPDRAYPERRAAVRRALALGMTPAQLRELASRLQDFRDLVHAASTWPRPAVLAEPCAVARSVGARLLALGREVDLEADDKQPAEVRRLQVIAERMAGVEDADDALRLLLQCEPKQVGGGRVRQELRSCAQEIAATIGNHRAAALADLLQHLRDFTLAHADRRRHAGEATFHDLLTRARDLLRDHAEVRTRAQRQFDRVFVDEFQDTDPLQVEIAWFVCADLSPATERDWTRLRLRPGKLFIVGDPKQSIYRFRRADIGIYEQVFERQRELAQPAVLRQSFRSPVPLVEWFNHHFAEDMQAVPRAQPPYRPLDARPADGVDGAALDAGVRHFGGFVERAAERWQAEATSVARVAREIVRGDRAWHISGSGGRPAAGAGTRPARWSDICVLIPSRTNLRRLERAFQAARVPYRIESGWLVLHTQEVRDLLSCLRAIDDPSDQVALVAALRSPAYACSDIDLLRWVDAGGRFDYERPGRGAEGPVRAALASLQAFHAERMAHTPAALTEQFIHERMLAVQAFGTPQPRDALRRLRYVVAQAGRLASSGQTTLRELCDWLESRQREQYYDAESAVPDADEDAVRFMTVHGSKGLEFPIVILTGLSTATSRVGPHSVDLVPDYESGVLAVRCGEFSTLGYVRDTEKVMYEAEQKRLLYVATTRARDHLVLSLFHGKDACHAQRILDRLAARPELSREFSLPPDGAGSAASTATATERAAERGFWPADGAAAESHRQAEAAWLAQRAATIARLANQAIVAPSALAHLADETRPDPPPEPDPSTYPPRLRRGRGGTRLGSAVHAVLQTIDLLSLVDLEALAAAAAAQEGIPDQAATVAEYVRAAAASAPIEHALASGRYWREVPVGVRQPDGSILEGAMDLLYERADGTLAVVDYKTDRVSDAQAATRAETYAGQGHAYAESVRQVTGRQVTSVEFVFAALAGRTVEIPLEPTAAAAHAS